MTAPRPRYALVARVRPHDEAAYLTYVRETYVPGLRQMPGFVSLRVVRWNVSGQPNTVMEGGQTEYLRMSTWTTKEAAEAYFAHPLRATFAKLLELATVIAYGGADVLVDLDADPTA